MKTIIEGVLAGDLPWGLVLTGAGLSIGAMLCGVSGLAFAIGVYLPLRPWPRSSWAAACARWWSGGAKGTAGGDPGVLAASGLVAGEGLAGVGVAGLVAFGLASRAREPLLAGLAGELAAVAVTLLIGYFLFRAGRTATTQGSR